MFLPKSGISAAEVDGLPNESGGENGMWIDADPISGCIVCNIGESESDGSTISRATHLPMFSVGDVDQWLV